ncbi:MAG TPA: FAA hydrolase family protein [Hellea balneolensis]|uniref:FAA hydrolase family protein n=1 Tax=Hellea balneolensis TaxID=287478 RepID=A0A7C5R108_9PROT|nr:FAA hydrolase family protein [Hellea balneolensis]
MKTFVIDSAPIKSLPIKNGNSRFPVRRIYCVGKNYKNHIAEMGGNPQRSTPVFFTKSRETIVETGAFIPYPPQTKNLHHEVELVVAMQSATEIFGYGVGLDMTRRDLQARAKEKGGPWDMAKNFDHSAPCSALTPAAEFDGLKQATITLEKNGETVQRSTLDQMIWSVEDILAHLAQTVTLTAGDLIFSGTPEGVGPVIKGDHLAARIDGLCGLDVEYV